MREPDDQVGEVDQPSETKTSLEFQDEPGVKEMRLVTKMSLETATNRDDHGVGSVFYSCLGCRFLLFVPSLLVHKVHS